MVAAIESASQREIGPVRGAIPAHPARFAIPESPLRNHEHTPVIRQSDSVLADTVALSGYAAFGVAQPTYSPPPSFGIGNNRPNDEYPGILSNEDDDDGFSTQSAGEEDAAGASGQTADTEEEEEVDTGQETNAKGEPLSDEEAKQLDKLQARDLEVRQHEQAHKATGGSLAGSISYSYQRGPDGKNYAVGGEVSIDVSRESDPSATISKMRRVRAAALAPADPSSQDRQVAAQATAQEAEARKELSQERVEETRGSGDSEKNGEEKKTGAAAGPDGQRQGNYPPGSLSASALASRAAPFFAAAPATASANSAPNHKRALVDVFA